MSKFKIIKSHLESIVDQLEYSVKNKPNIISQLGKVLRELKKPFYEPIMFYNPNLLFDVVKNVISPKKQREVIQSLYKVGVHMNMSKKSIDLFNDERNKLKEIQKDLYKKNVKYVENNFEDVKKKLIDNINSPNVFKRRLSIFYAYVGALRIGELQQTKISAFKTSPKKMDDNFNWISYRTNKMYINQHKNKRFTGQRIIDLPNEFIDLQETSKADVYYLSDNLEERITLSKITRTFKEITGVTPTDYRHMESENSRINQNFIEQIKTSKKNGHSRNTMIDLYSNEFYNGKITVSQVVQSKKHYLNLLKLYNSQNVETSDELIEKQ